MKPFSVSSPSPVWNQQWSQRARIAFLRFSSFTLKPSERAGSTSCRLCAPLRLEAPPPPALVIKNNTLSRSFSGWAACVAGSSPLRDARALLLEIKASTFAPKAPGKMIYTPALGLSRCHSERFILSWLWLSAAEAGQSPPTPFPSLCSVVSAWMIFSIDSFVHPPRQICTCNQSPVDTGLITDLIWHPAAFLVLARTPHGRAKKKRRH